MAFYLDPLYKSMVRQFKTITNDPEFQMDFIDAVNVALDMLYDESGALDDPIAHAVSHNGTISELSEDDFSIMSRIVAYALVLSGRKHVRGDAAYQIMKDEKDDAIGDFTVKTSEEDQDDVDDDGRDADIIGLGDREDN